MAKKKETENKKVTSLLEDIENNLGKGLLFKVSDKPREDISKISSGSLLLDKALGGGYPEGRIIEIYGSESSGKTTLTLQAIAEAQKKGYLAAFIDAEHALDLDYAATLGVDVDNLFISQPDYGEQALEILDKIVDSGEFKIVVIDSVAALTPKKEIEGAMGDSVMGVQARLMSQACRKLTGKISKTNTTCIFLNQIRQKIGVVFGTPDTTTGGNALKFYASQRLELKRRSQLKTPTGEVLGHEIDIKVVKNKIAPPFKVASTKLYYGLGVSKADEIIDLSISQGLITKAGSWFSYGDTKLGQGQALVRDLLRDNIELLEELESLIKI